MQNKKTKTANKYKDVIDGALPQYEHIFDDNKQEFKQEKIHFFRKVFKNNKFTIIISYFIYFLQAIPTFLIPIVTADIIDMVAGSLSGKPIDFTRLIIEVSVTVVSIVLNSPFTRLRYRIICKLQRNVLAGLRRGVVRKLQSISITYHKELQTGKVEARFLNSVDKTYSYLHRLNFSIVPNIMMLCVYIGIAIWRGPLVLAFFTVAIPLNIGLIRFFIRKLSVANRELRIERESMSAKFNTMLTMIPVTKSHGLENREINSMTNAINNVGKTEFKTDMINAKFGTVIFIVSNLMSFVCLSFLCFLAYNRIITIGEISLFQSMFGSLNGFINSITYEIGAMTEEKEAIHALSEIMTVSDVERAISKVEVEKIRGDIEFRNVYYRYPKNSPYVVKDFSLDVKAGECIAVVGASGSGKSTIMNMIIGFLTPEKGEIFVDGENINDINLTEYRHNISVVPQNSILFNGTIRDNITYGLGTYSEEDLNRVIKMANMEEFLKEMPNGIDTEIGEHGDKLSGGQKQRITIARALIRDPRILILDEATSALDNMSEYAVQKAIESSVKGRTTFIVAHRLSTIRNADRIVVMEQGEIVECGTYNQLMAKKGKFFELKSLNDATNKQANEELS